MGSKIKIYLLALAICTALPVCSQILPYIPQTTLEIAQSVAVTKQKPASEVVRVGIGTTNFGTYQYNDITIFGTGDTQIYDNKMLIANISANQNVRITFKNGMFTITTPQYTERVAEHIKIKKNLWETGSETRSIFFFFFNFLFSSISR